MKEDRACRDHVKLISLMPNLIQTSTFAGDLTSECDEIKPLRVHTKESEVVIVRGG